MSRISILAAFAAAVTFVPAAAVASDSSSGISEPAKEKKVCRRMVDTGSIMSKKTCRTRKDWQQVDQQNHENAQNATDRRNNTVGQDTPN